MNLSLWSSRRYSYIGKKLIPIQDAAIAINRNDEVVPNLFGKTKIAQKIYINGPLGKCIIPIHSGLAINRIPSEEGDCLQIHLDNSFEALDHPAKRFVRAMWGTTNSLIRNSIVGVCKVHSGLTKLIF